MANSSNLSGIHHTHTAPPVHPVNHQVHEPKTGPKPELAPAPKPIQLAGPLIMPKPLHQSSTDFLVASQGSSSQGSSTDGQTNNG